MRPFFAYLAVLMMVVGIVLGMLWYTSPQADTQVANGPTFPSFVAQGQVGDPFVGSLGLAFTSPYGVNNSSFTYHVSYQYGSSQASVYIQKCPPGQTFSCSSPGPSAPLLLNLSGASASGSFTGKAGQWYVAVSNEPVIVTVTANPEPTELVAEVAAAVLFFGGGGLLVVGLILRDPKARPTPRLARLKRTLYFFFQSKLAVFGLAILLFYVAVAVLSPVLAPYSGTNSTPTNGDASSLSTYCAYTPSYVEPSTPGGCSFPQCVYASNNQPPMPGNCVAYPVTGFPALGNPANVPPTWSGVNLGPLPMGSILFSQSYFLNTYQAEIRATPWDLTIAGAVVLSGATIGLLLGAVAGFSGGYFDEVVMRVTDVFLSIPGLFLVLVILAVFTASVSSSTSARIGLLIGAFVITWWPSYTRIVRGQVLVTREQKYVEAAQASGAKSGRILRKHIIPNSVYPVLVSMSLDIGTVPLLLGAIAFLGFAAYVFPSTSTLFPEWGVLSAWTVSTSGQNSNNIFSIIVGGQPFPWWQILFPGLALFLFAISVNFLADGLRDALDPRLRR